MIKSIKYFIQFIIVIFLFIIFFLIGRKLASNLSSYIFKTFGKFFRSSEIIRGNLKICFPENSDIQNDEIINKMWDNYGRTLAEYINLRFFQNNNDHIKILNLDKLEKLKNSKDPVLFFSGHFANFELMAMELEKQNFQISALYRKLNNFFLNPIMEFFRTSYICKDQIAKPLPGEDKGGTRELLSRVKDRRNIALMVDQKLTEGIIAKLFNKDCYTTRIPAQFAKKYNYKLVPISLKRVDKYFFEMNILDEINFSKEDSELQITNRINNVIEKMIKENPDQWIWTHKRWKI
tara:strand:+ start:766 stop:1641 length:876 start_codon:yes stop_codon:yes gene_type:complete